MKKRIANPLGFRISFARLLVTACFCAVLGIWWHSRGQLEDALQVQETLQSQLQRLHRSNRSLEDYIESQKRVPSAPPARTPHFLAADEVGLEYIAHSCFRLYSSGGTRILIDPFAGVWVGYKRPDSILTEPVDAVVITHPHYDHDAGEFIGKHVEWPPDAQMIRDPGRFTVGDLQIIGVQGKHAAGHGGEFDYKNTMFVFEVAGLRIVHYGDNEPVSEETAGLLGRVDILMIPIDAEEHLLKHAEVEIIRELLKPRIVIPMHYKHPDLEIEPDNPRGLGPIDPWLANQSSVRRLSAHTTVFSVAALPAKPEILVFQHAPFVRRGGPPRREDDGPNS